MADSVSIVTLAERIARHAHADQVDKSGRPYVEHLERVVGILKRRWPDATDIEIAAAWLHDLFEDQPQWDRYVCAYAGVPSDVIAIVQELARPRKSTYLAWVQSLAALGSLSAVKIKLADNEDNSDPERVAAWADGERMLRTRYAPAKKMLEARLVREVAT